jgi:hypothetical protein
MRGTWGVLLLLLAITALACNGKSSRVMREPSVQMYGLPPMDAKVYNEPVTYPEDKLAMPSQKKGVNMPPGGLGGMGGGGGMPGGGVAGTNPGGLGGYR